MVKITGNFGKAKTFINTRIRVILHNTFAGIDSGIVATGDYNNFFGYLAGYSNTTGYNNNFIGAHAGYANTAGHHNNFFGRQAGYANTAGFNNNFFGPKAGYANVTGYNNNFFGYRAGYSNTTGYHNSFFGNGAGYSNATGHHNNFFGDNAGYFENESNRLFIDNLPRTDKADGRIKALIYGLFDAATANQLLRINGILELTEIKSGATQVGAGAVANEVWKTASHATLPDNVLMVGV